MNPNTFEESLGQAETACFEHIASLLELTVGKEATIGISNGLPDAAVFDIGSLSVGDMTAFPASAHCWRAVLDLYNRDRAQLQRWIMRLIEAYPVSRWYKADDPLREDSNVVHFRIAPERGAVSQIKTTTVQSSNSGEVPTWTCRIDFDVVFIADPDYTSHDAEEESGSGGDSESGDSESGDSGGTTGGDDDEEEETTDTPTTTYYKHSIEMSGKDDANNDYTATFNFTNTTSTAYTTSRQIADALRALGYYERNGVAATGESELETDGHNVSFVCGYSEEYCNGNEDNLQTLLFLDETEYHSLVFAVNEEDALTDTVTTTTSGGATDDDGDEDDNPGGSTGGDDDEDPFSGL